MTDSRTYKVSVWTHVNAVVEFHTDIDPVLDPEAFREALAYADVDYPSENISNDFELGDEWFVSEFDDKICFTTDD